MKRLFDGGSCYLQEFPVLTIVCTPRDEKEKKNSGFLLSQE